MTTEQLIQQLKAGDWVMMDYGYADELGYVPESYAVVVSNICTDNVHVLKLCRIHSPATQVCVFHCDDKRITIPGCGSVNLRLDRVDKQDVINHVARQIENVGVSVFLELYKEGAKND